MNTLLNAYLNLMNLVTDEEGQDLIEYALIVALISIVAVVALTALGGNINTLWTTISANVGKPWNIVSDPE